MTNFNEWKLAQKLQASGTRGMIIGICIAVLIIAAIVIAVVKICMLKRNYCCDCEMDEFDEDYYLDPDEIEDIDENGCAYTSEKDFV
jgi:hypothetical protein